MSQLPRPQDQLDFRLLFESVPGLYLVLHRDLTIAAVSNEYLRATMTEREKILGRNIFDVFPDNPEDPNATWVRNLSASLQSVLKNQAPHTMPVQRYDVGRSKPEGADFEVRYWSPVNSPVFGKDGGLAYIIHRVEDVTSFVQLKQQDAQQNRLTEELRERADRMEAEVFLRAQEIEERGKELQRLNEALHKSRDEAIESASVKAAFISTISHELRTPLTGLLGFLELLMLSDLTEEQHDLASTALQSANELLLIVNDILDLSKIEAGKVDLERIAFKPSTVIEDTCRLLSQSAKKKALNLRTELKEVESCSMLGDPARLRQVLLNLIGNSIKFTETGEISITASIETAEGQDKLCVSVADTGIGIAEEDKRFLFLPFSQLDSSNTRKFGGAGLGLAISKRLVEMMGGEIGFTSQKGQGSTFWCALPLIPQISTSASTMKRIHTSPQTQLQLAGKKPVVLIVEDNPVVQTVVIKQLINMGIRAHAVSNGQAALESLKGLSFNAILMDCQMPGMDGFETTRLIREMETRSGRRTRIIAMTAGAMTTDEQKNFLSCGMDDYLVKPFNYRQLKEKLEELNIAPPEDCST